MSKLVNFLGDSNVTRTRTDRGERGISMRAVVSPVNHSAFETFFRSVANHAPALADKLLIIITSLPVRITMTDLYEANASESAAW